MPYAQNAGIRIHYEIIGSGPPLVLQHGFFWSMAGWKRVGYVDVLKSRFQLILIDARGHGASDKPHDGDAYALQRHIGDITNVLDAVHLDAAHFWGFSMGGWFAYGMAKYAADRVRSLIVGAAHPYARRLPPESRPSGDNPDAFIDAFFRRLRLDRAKLSQAELAEFYENDFVALSASLQDRPALEHVLTRIKVPCLVYVGSEDGICAEVETCAKLIPDAKFVLLPGLNHPETFYRSDLVLPPALEFLERAPSA